jgi:hypothetical protein
MNLMAATKIEPCCAMGKEGAGEASFHEAREVANFSSRARATEELGTRFDLERDLGPSGYSST